jgi:phenylacetic acid degradation operon negative regulatory protein
MQPKTEELLHLLLWSAERLTRPTFRNLTDSYEAWAYRSGLLRQTAKLEKHRLIERDHTNLKDRIYRLTEHGRLHALGGRDPEAQWSRRWDGKWRLVLFDLPMDRQVQRGKLRRYLRARGFGCLQGSVWVTPNPTLGEREILAGGVTDVESLLLLEARPCAGERDEEIVAGAWDFPAINRRYARYLKVLERWPEETAPNSDSPEVLLRWAADERRAWQAAVEVDPLLPQRLLPKDYLGRQAWNRRVEILGKAGRLLRSLSPGIG